MKFGNMTPSELAEKTVKDIAAKRKLAIEGKKQAERHCMENRNKIKRRISHGRH